MSQPYPEDQISQEILDPNEIIEIPLEEAAEDIPQEEQKSNLPIEETNLAEDLEEDELNEIAKRVIEDYESDLESRGEWERKNAEYLKLFYQTDRAENPPWDGSSDESIPALTEAVNQFQSRTYKAFFPNRYFVDAIPVGKSNEEARERGERIAAHMNFQLGVLDRTYKRNKNQMFMAVAIHGSDFTKTYFNHLKKRTVIERVRAQDLVVPYHVGPIAIEELERKTHVKYVSINQVRMLEKLGFFLEGAKSYSGDYSTEAQDVSDDAIGVEDVDTLNLDRKDALILEQHCSLDLDEDGIAEPYIVWVDKQSEKTLRIQIRYEVDEFGIPLKDKEPIEYFTHYQFLPNPDGFYGFGFGHLLAKINLALNKLIRMFIDAGELSTTGNLTYLISEYLGIPGDDFELVMGKGIKIPRSVDDISKHFMKLDFKGPSPELATIIEFLQQAVQRVSSSSDILAGQPDKVYQPTALLSMLEQGLQLYSTIQEHLGYSMEDELNKVYRINAKYLTSEEYIYEGDKQITVTPEDYKDDFRIVPIFDPKYSTRSQKLAKAEAELQFVSTFPMTAQNPQSLYLAGKRYLECLDTENIDEILPPPQAPQVARIDDQNLENSYYIMPPDKRPLFDVFGDQDHIGHIKKIDEFITSFLDGGEAMEIPINESTTEQNKNTPKLVNGDPGIKRLVQSMSNEQKQELIANLLRHRAQHLAYMYGQLNGVMDAQGNAIAGQAGSGQVAQTSGNNTDLEVLSRLLESGFGPA